MRYLQLIQRDYLDGFLQTRILGANFRAERNQRTAEHMAVFYLDFTLKFIACRIIFLQAFQRRNSGRKMESISSRQSLCATLNGFHRQFRFGIEEIINRPFDARLRKSGQWSCRLLLSVTRSTPARYHPVNPVWHQRLRPIKSFCFIVSALLPESRNESIKLD